MDLLPSLLHFLIEEPDFQTCSSLKHVFTGGEALRSQLVHEFYKNCKANLYNTYGPTEATVEASVWNCTDNLSADIAPIGKPIAGAKLYVLDRHRNFTPIGMPGELCIGGIGLSRGYLNNPALTNAKFIKGFNGDRLFCTGDLVKFRPDGNIEFLGRIDRQVKIRGFRIELEEIESTLMRCDDIAQAVVIVKGEELNAALIAYVVLKRNLARDKALERIREVCKKWLPSYMIPPHILILDKFPKLLNGKINLRELSANKIEMESPAFQNWSPWELAVGALWEEVLGKKPASPSDDFFALGGNSLLALRLIASVKKKLEIEVALMELFKNPSFGNFCDAIKNGKKSQLWSPLVKMQNGRGKFQKAPFFCVHPVGGGVLCYRSLSKDWYEDRDFYAIQARGLLENQEPHRSIPAMASEYLNAIRQVQAHGPYLLGGWSFGGLVAAEMAHQLSLKGEDVFQLVLIDTTAKLEWLKKTEIENDALLLSELRLHYQINGNGSGPDLSPQRQLLEMLEMGGKQRGHIEPQLVDRLIMLVRSHYHAVQSYTIPMLIVPVSLIRCQTNTDPSNDLGWRKYASNLQVFQGEGDHWAITDEKHSLSYASLLEQCFNF